MTTIDVVEKLVIVLVVLGIADIVCYSTPLITIVAVIILFILLKDKKGGDKK